MHLLRVLGAVVLTLGGVSAHSSSAYIRYPAVQGDTVVFTAEGDLWAVAARGGNARRLTTHAADESRAAISPDGRWVAFSAGYEGPVEAYVMPLAGGQPTRVSFENSRALVVGWTAAGEVLYSAPHAAGPVSLRVVKAVQPQSLALRTFPLADANDATIDADGRWMYFVRFGLSVTNDNARGYRGGALSQLWRYDLRSDDEAQRIGPTDVSVRRPMWWNGRLVVISDGDGRDNLWSLAADGGDARALTRHADFDVRSASIDGDRVVYQLGTDLRAFDLRTGDDHAIPLTLTSDFDQARERWIDDPLRYVESTTFAPKGDRIAITARGGATLAGLGALRRIDIAAPPGSRLGSAVLSPDGKTVYAICDATGEEEIWRFPANGSAGGEALTHDGDGQRWNIHVSPDGKSIVHDDKRGRLWLLDIGSERHRVIDDGGPDGNESYTSVTWAPDSRHVAFARQTSASGRNRIALHSLDTGSTQWLTSDKYESASPVFSPDGQWLWFLSERHFRLVNGSPWGDRNSGPYFDRRTKIYGLALQAGTRFPFRPHDELASDTEEKPGNKDDKATADAKPTVPAIAWDGLADRLYEVPLAAGNYSALQASGDRLYILERNGQTAALKYLPVDNKHPTATEFASNVSEFALSADGKTIYVRRPGDGDTDFGTFLIAETPSKLPDDLSRVTVKLDDWTVRVDPRAEWRQMFADAWRMHRDYFYDSGLRAVDWPAVRVRYAPLLDRVADRNDLDDLLAQMMGELGALHSQIVSGDVRSADDGAASAGLGARFERVDDGWRVAHVYRTEAELPGERGPLQAPDADVRVGDVIVAINGRSTVGVRDLSDLLRNRAGQQVLLDVRRGSTASRQVIVTAVDARREETLRYGDWVQAAREKVERRGGGSIGYLHLFAMGPNDIATFVREFYGQFDRDGLIIDVRRNRGGNIDSWIIEKLLRRAWAFWSRPGGLPYTNMQQTFRGHLAVLTDELTYSDGETFAAGVKSLKLGPLIGTRTAGAGVWLSDGNRLVDGGRARVAEFPQYGMDGQWLVEGIGVVPDIVVENAPRATFNGEDAQLDAAIGWLQRKLKSDPVPAMTPRAIPPLAGSRPAEPAR